MSKARSDLDTEPRSIKKRYIFVIVCNRCQGRGKVYSIYSSSESRDCQFCEGTGTFRLKKPKKQIESAEEAF